MWFKIYFLKGQSLTFALTSLMWLKAISIYKCFWKIPLVQAKQQPTCQMAKSVFKSCMWQYSLSTSIWYQYRVKVLLMVEAFVPLGFTAQFNFPQRLLLSFIQKAEIFSLHSVLNINLLFYLYFGELIISVSDKRQNTLFESINYSSY